MLVSAGENIEGYKIIEHRDMIFGFASSVEGPGFRQTAVKRACSAAETKGANAIVNVHIEIYSISESNQEATVYGDAVIVEPVNENYKPAESHRVNFEAYIPKEKSASANIMETNGYKFVSCPRCGTKYKTDIDDNGNVHIKGFEDVDGDEPGLQIYCLRCGTKFTVPGS